LKNTEGIEKLFFDLASESRLDILNALRNENLKMHEITRKLDLTATEAFRQLERLCETLLIQKEPEGTYALTNYAKLILHLFPSFEFAFKHKKYFLAHDVWKLPYPFINRLAELSQGSMNNEIVEVMNKMEEMIKASEDHVWVITNQVLAAHNNAMKKKLPEGVKFRALLHEKLIKPSQTKVPAEQNVENRVLSDIPGIVLTTEKEAGVCLFLLNGEIGRSALFGSDPLFLKWVNDLFFYYWDQGKRQYQK
jgi:predicted transcriptional regulator